MLHIPSRNYCKFYIKDTEEHKINHNDKYKSHWQITIIKNSEQKINYRENILVYEY